MKAEETLLHQAGHWLQDILGLSPATQGKLLTSIVAILLLGLLRAIVLRIALKRINSPSTQYRWRKITSYVTFVLAFFFVGRIWFQGIGSLSTYLGLISAGIAIAMKDPLVNLAGWFFIIWRKPFGVGDRIAIAGVAGDVIDQRLFQFSILEIGNWVDADQPTGRIIQMPNGKVFSEPVANYDKGFRFIWNEMPVLVTFESDWQEAERLLNEIAKEEGERLGDAAVRELRAASSRYLISQRELTPRVFISTRDSGVLLTLRFATRIHDRRESSDRVWKKILLAFGERDTIDFAYPTTRYYDNIVEGKPGARASRPDAPSPGATEEM